MLSLLLFQRRRALRHVAAATDHEPLHALYCCDVQIKKMRAGLIDEEGFEGFGREVVMLATLDHEFIVEFKGYCLEPALVRVCDATAAQCAAHDRSPDPIPFRTNRAPALTHAICALFHTQSRNHAQLIIMTFVDGGTLKDFIRDAASKGEHPSPESTMAILIGCAKALAYLHAMQPAPILHRDIKSENILLTKDGEPRIADLGEARTAANRTMTAVGTNGYTAPEV